MTFDFSDFFTFGKEIGRGAYGTVYIATIKKPYPPLQVGSLVAIKSISTSRITSVQEKEKLETEISLMSKLDHPNIVKLYGVEKTSSHYYLILEYCNGGDLFQYMKTIKNNPKEKTTSYISTASNYEIINFSNIFSSEESIRDFASQIASGLFYLHSHQIVHRDLKPHNILISRTKSNKHQSSNKNDSSEKIILKIADFGFARFLKPSDLATTVCGSPVYMAPEIQFGSQYSSNVDMWSLGIILYELITGQTPFPRVKTQYELAMELKNKGSKSYSLPSTVKASPELRNLIEKLLTINPTNRMTFSEFMNDPFINMAKNSKNTKNSTPESVKSKTAKIQSSTKNEFKTQHTKNEDQITIDEDFDFEIISSSSFAIVPEKSPPKNSPQGQIQNTKQPQSQGQNRVQILNQSKVHSAETLSSGLSSEVEFTSPVSLDSKSSFLELTESFKERQKFSFISSFPEVGAEQAVEYLTEAYTSADTIISHFTECQNISNELLINIEMLIIRFLIDFLVEEKHLSQLTSKSTSNFENRNLAKISKGKKNVPGIEKDVFELIKVCMKELTAIMIDSSDDVSYEESESESDPDLISFNLQNQPNSNSNDNNNVNVFSGTKSSIVPNPSLPLVNKNNSLLDGPNTNSNKKIESSSSVKLNENRKIVINFNDNVEVVSNKKEIEDESKKRLRDSGMQFLFSKAVEYAKDAAKLEISRQFEFAALKYQRALYLLQPIAFSKKFDDQIKAARDLYKKIDERKVNASLKSSK